MPATAERFTDKMLTNLLYVGLIHLALLNARIIHARRDPVDTCPSCFTQFFVEGHNFANDLGELARYYRACEEAATQWHRVLPAGTMLEVQYEEVVADPEMQARRGVGYWVSIGTTPALPFIRSSGPSIRPARCWKRSVTV